MKGRLFFIAAVTLLVAVAALHLVYGGMGDQEWLLLATHKMLTGRKLYVDVFEVNPPLVLWLYALPSWLSMHGSPWTDSQLLAFMGVAACMGCSFLGLRLIRHHPGFEGDGKRQYAFALLVAYTLLGFTTPVYFFDRDHIFFVLTFPYLLRSMPSLADKPLSFRLRIVTGLLAGIGFCAKPHAVIVFAGIQLLILVHAHRLRALATVETRIVIAAVMVYVACIAVFTPDYFSTVLPVSLATYGGFERKVNSYLFGSIALFSAGLSLADYRLRYRTPYHADIGYFVGAALVFLVYALAGNGWGYTYNPLLCTLLFLSGWMLFEYRWLLRRAREKNEPTRPFFSGICACGINLALNSFYMMMCVYTPVWGNPCRYSPCPTDVYTQYIREHQVQSFATMSMNLRRWTGLSRRTGADWTTRFNHLWMLPKLLQDKDHLTPKEQWVREYVSLAYAKDLTRFHPDMVLVDRSDVIFGYGHPVDIPLYLSENQAFAKAWKGYRLAETIDLCKKAETTPGADGTPPEPAPVGIDCRYDIYVPASH